MAAEGSLLGSWTNRRSVLVAAVGAGQRRRVSAQRTRTLILRRLLCLVYSKLSKSISSASHVARSLVSLVAEKQAARK